MRNYWRRFLLLSLIILMTGVLIAGCNQEQPTQPTTATIPEGELDPAVWGKVYPDHYASYLKQEEQKKGNSKYGGSVPISHIKESPVQVKLFAGYPFSEDYNEERGHVWSLEDVINTQRIGPKTISSCWNCKSPNVKPRLLLQFLQ